MKRIIHGTLALLILLVGSAFADFSVNVNTADADTLAAALNGVGPARAQAIVEHREQYGPFESIDALLEVAGVGPAVLEANRDNIRLEDE